MQIGQNAFGIKNCKIMKYYRVKIEVRRIQSLKALNTADFYFKTFLEINIPAGKFTIKLLVIEKALGIK